MASIEGERVTEKENETLYDALLTFIFKRKEKVKQKV